jgi:TATA-binding protein-associated factor Taf7
VCVYECARACAYGRASVQNIGDGSRTKSDQMRQRRITTIREGKREREREREKERREEDLARMHTYEAATNSRLFYFLEMVPNHLEEVEEVEEEEEEEEEDDDDVDDNVEEENENEDEEAIMRRNLLHSFFSILRFSL